MGAEPRETTGKRDGNGATPEPIPAERREELNKRLKLDSAQIAQVEKLDVEQREQWYRLVETWFAPERWLATADKNARERQPVAAFHVPTAEGIATYGGLPDPEKSLAVELLERTISTLPDDVEPHNGNGNGNGNGTSASDAEADPEQ